MPSRVIAPHQLPPARVDRIVCHWTGGGYRVSAVDRLHYHIILQDDSALRKGEDVSAYRGIWTPADNENCRDVRYAAHTRGLNTGSFGLAVACMGGGAKHGGPFGTAPLTRLLWERMAQAAAEVCHRYGIILSERTVLQHGEAERIYGADQNGKWDITQLPFDPKLPPADVCALFRRRVNWYLHRVGR